MTERRYGDEEIREIFAIATTGEGAGNRAPAAESDGMTLRELQRIGEEAGIEPARVVEAAARLEARGRAAPLRRSLGLPVGVSRVVDLPRAPTDREWEQLIAEFRSTFGARGEHSSAGGLREWSVGELHICVEPTARGHQLRLSTLKSDGQALNALGIALTALGTIMSLVVTAAGKGEKALAVFAMFAGMGAIGIVANVLRLPRWARERERQMEALAGHTVQLLREGSTGEGADASVPTDA